MELERLLSRKTAGATEKDGVGDVDLFDQHDVTVSKGKFFD